MRPKPVGFLYSVTIIPNPVSGVSSSNCFSVDFEMGECQSSHEDHENHVCKLVGEGMQEKHPEEYHKLVKDAQFVCKSCGRVAAGKVSLCDPVELGSWD